MTDRRRLRFLLEAALAGAAALLAVVTLVWRDWIEAVFGIDPDRQSGALEWLLATVLLALALVCGRRARAAWRRGSVGAHCR